MVDPAHGGLLTHYALPAQVIREIEAAGFQLVIYRGDDFPRSSGQFVTDWYYYVFAKTSTGEECSA